MSAVAMQLIEASNAFFAHAIGRLGLRTRDLGSFFPYSHSPEFIDELIAAGKFPSLQGLAPAFTYFLILNAVRYILQNFIIKPVATRLMKLKEVSYQPVKDIDRALPWKAKTIYSSDEIATAAKSLGRSSDEVIRYLSIRKLDKMNSQKIVKFVEAFWRAVFYFGFSVLGYKALFLPQPAIWWSNTEHHFKDWPHHELTPALDLYYTIQLGCYVHQLLWTEVSRSDAAEMITHHLVTIVLITTSYVTGFFRIGSSILFLHDLSDIFLETAKVFNYISKPLSQRWLKGAVVDPLFGIFAIVFFVTRLVLYPRNILLSVLGEGYNQFGCDWTGCATYVGLLTTLQCLHIFWFYLIARMIVKLAMGTMKDDERSDDEDEHEDAEPVNQPPASTSSKSKKSKKNKKQ